MNRHSIRRRLAFLMLLPIVSMLYFGSSIVRDRHREANEMARVSSLSEVAVKAGELLHQIQRERGLSAGFLGARGEGGFRAQLSNQRGQSDIAISAFRSAVEQVGSVALGPALSQASDAIFDSLKDLAARRAGVDGLDVQVPQVLAFYTELNRRTLAMATEMAREARAPEVASRATAYVGFMRAKEAAGIERAVLANTFGAGRFGPGMYARLLSLVALQEDYLTTFKVYGGPPAQQRFDQAMKGEFVEATEQMRASALASGGGEITGVDSKTWFARQTEKIDAMAEVESWLARDIIDTSLRLSSQAQRAFFISALAMGIVALMTFLLAAIVVRSIVRPLGRAVEVLGAVAGGDFTRHLDVEGKDEVGQMATSLNAAIASIHQALGDVREVSTSVAAAAEQISAASAEMANGAQRQASNLEETAAALEQITATVRQNSANAQRANELAVGARDVAERGGKTVGEAVTAMVEINRSSKRIGEISTAIDEIAFQTNLLALNAAVEAARAGEQGRGFAVVASAVRELAQRSSSAAKEIKTLIQESVHSVEVGTGLVNRSGQMLEEIVASARRVTDLIAEMAVASKEQAAGIEQVSKAVAQMDQVTQANAGQTEEMSGTAQAMAQRAEQLRALVTRFRLSDDDRSTSPTPRSPRANGPSARRPTPANGVPMMSPMDFQADELQREI